MVLKKMVNILGHQNIFARADEFHCKVMNTSFRVKLPEGQHLNKKMFGQNADRSLLPSLHLFLAVADDQMNIVGIVFCALKIVFA